MQDGLSAPVAGPSALFPRGYMWIAPAWFLIIGAVLAVVPWPPAWFRYGVLAGLFVALITLLAALSSVRVNAFTADQTGIRLGLPANTSRRGLRRRQATQLSWQQIERVRIVTNSRRVRLEIILSPGTASALRFRRPSPAHNIAKWIPLAVIPFWYLHWPTGLISPMDRPARFVVHLRDVTVDDLRQTIRAIAPPEVAVSVLVHNH